MQPSANKSCQTGARFFLQVHLSTGTDSVMETKNFEPLKRDEPCKSLNYCNLPEPPNERSQEAIVSHDNPTKKGKNNNGYSKTLV